MEKIRNFLDEHLNKILIGLIALVSVIFVIIIFTLIIGENGDRSIIVSEVSGGVFVEKNDGKVPAIRNMKISDGDIIVTEQGGNIKLKTDRGKYIYIEPRSTVYINYTSKAEKGSIVVNISDGSVLCRLDSKLSSKASFEVRTPNSTASVTGTIFHTRFDYYDDFSGFENVMLTSYRCVEGNVLISLYDPEGNQSDVPVTLLEGNAAELMSSTGFTGYNCTNQPYALTEFSADTLRTLINISGSRSLPYTLNELNNAHLTVSDREQPVTEAVITAPETSSIYRFETADTPVYGTLPPYTERTLRETESVTSEETQETVIIPSETVTESSGQTSVTQNETSYNSYVFTEPEITVFTVPTDESDGVITASSETSDPSNKSESGLSSSESSEDTSEAVSTTAIPWWEIINSGLAELSEKNTDSTEKSTASQTESQASESTQAETSLSEEASEQTSASSDTASETSADP